MTGLVCPKSPDSLILYTIQKIKLTDKSLTQLLYFKSLLQNIKKKKKPVQLKLNEPQVVYVTVWEWYVKEFYDSK